MSESTTETARSGYHRDTRAHALGSLAETLLQAAFSQEAIRHSHERWLARVALDPSLATSSERLLRTGVSGGEVLLSARASRDDFRLDLSHSDFEAVVVAGFDHRTSRLAGVWVVRFEGRTMSVVQFANAIVQQIRCRVLLSDNSTSLEDDNQRSAKC